MAWVLEENVHTTLAASVSGGASSIDTNKASSPWNDPPDPGGSTSALILTDSTASPSKIEIITYSTRTDNGDGTYTLGGVAKNAYGGHGDQSWSSGDIAIQGPLTTPDQWGSTAATAGDLAQYDANARLTSAKGGSGNNPLVQGDRAANSGDIPAWSDGSTDDLATRLEDGSNSGPLILTPDPLRMAVEAATGGRITVLYDDSDYPNYMHVIPRFRYEDLGYSTEMGTGTATAFLKNGTDKAEIFVGVYQADSNGASLPHRTPQVNVDYDSALSQCTSKGTGWHLFTAHEWAAIALWCMSNGYEPRGNTDHGRSHASTHEVGVRQDGDTYPPGDSSGNGIHLTGSGPDAWRHDDGSAGIADLVGNVWEWMHLLKIVDGEFFSPSDNDYDLDEASWPTLSRFVSNASGTPTLEDSQNSAGTNKNVTWSSTPTGTYTTSEVMKRLLIEPAGISPQGRFYVRDFDERLPLRGGDRGYGSDAGLAALSLNNARSRTSTTLGFRPAFVA